MMYVQRPSAKRVRRGSKLRPPLPVAMSQQSITDCRRCVEQLCESATARMLVGVTLSYASPRHHIDHHGRGDALAAAGRQQVVGMVGYAYGRWMRISRPEQHEESIKLVPHGNESAQP